MNILCFDKNLPETGKQVKKARLTTDVLDDQTYEVTQSRVVKVERDDVPLDNVSTGRVTIYLEEKDGRVWYMNISNEELEMIKQVE